MPETFIDLKVAKDDAIKIEEDSEMCDSAMKRLKEYIEYTRYAWVGNAADIFVDRLNDYVTELNTCSSLFKEDSSKLDISAKNYEKLEEYFLGKEM